jgi:hypothetical protein
MPTTALERLHLRTQGAFVHNFVPAKDIFAGHRKVTIAPAILDDLDTEALAADYFASIADLPIVARWEALHCTVVEVGDSLELYDPQDHDVHDCVCTGVLDDLIWVQREGRSPEIADLACLQPQTSEFGEDEF